MRKIKIILVFIIGLLLQACPTDDGPNGYITIINQSAENIFYHGTFTSEYPENFLLSWEPNDNFFILSNDSISYGINFPDPDENQKCRVFVYKSSTLEANDWEIVRDNGLYDARYDLTLEELEAMDFEIIYDGM